MKNRNKYRQRIYEFIDWGTSDQLSSGCCRALHLLAPISRELPGTMPGTTPGTTPRTM